MLLPLHLSDKPVTWLFVLCVGQSAVLARNTDWDALADEVVDRLTVRSRSSSDFGLSESLVPLCEMSKASTASLRTMGTPQGLELMDFRFKYRFP